MQEHREPSDEGLRTLLREARPESHLPPRFQESVWRRIEQAERPAVSLAAKSWVDVLIERLLQPRFALAASAALLLVGGLSGLADGSVSAKRLAQERYLSAVAPNSFR
jgi:hypothetical protein